MTSAALLLALALGPVADTTYTPAALPVLANSTPAAVVAERVRAVLRNHDDPEEWRQLAGVLPDMAVTGQAEWEGTLEAARLADSISGPPETARTVPAPRTAGTGWIGALFGRLRPSDIGSILTTLVALGVIAWSMQASGFLAWRRRTTASRGPQPGSPTGTTGTKAPRRATPTGRRTRTPASPPPQPSSRRREIMVLAQSGLTLPEIARRTGMAQDAVSVIMGMTR